MTTHDEVLACVRETCILASVRFTQLGQTRTDKSASDEVADTKGAKRGAAKVVVNRMTGAEDFHREISSAQREAKLALNGMSMIWSGEDAWRLLPNQNFERFLREFAQAKGKFDKARARLIASADAIIATARLNLGGLNVEPPTRDELVGAYTMDYAFHPIPSGAAFPALPGSARDKLVKRLDRRIAEAVRAAQDEILGRFIQPLEYFVERMQIYDERVAAEAQGQDPGRTGVFRDTVLTNIQDLYGILQSCNIAGDDRMVELGNMLASLVAHKPDELRDNAEKRRLAVERVQQARATLNDWLAPPARAAAE